MRPPPSPTLPSEAAERVVVVGAGLAGCELSASLAENGNECLLIEAGPDAGRVHYREELSTASADALWLQPELDPYYWRPYNTRGSGFLSPAGLRSRVGGRSLYWHGVVAPIEAWALRDWPRRVVNDLCISWQGGASLYVRMLEEIARWCGHDEVGSQVPVYRLAGRDMVRAPKAVRMGTNGWAAYHRADGIPAAVRLEPNTRVLQVETSEGHVTGVLVQGPKGYSRISSGRVVLAAGTIENTRLFVRAGHGEPGPSADERSLYGLVDKVAQGFMVGIEGKALPPELRPVAESEQLLMSIQTGQRSRLLVGFHTNVHGVCVLDVYMLGEQQRSDAGVVSVAALTGEATVTCELGSRDRAVVARQRQTLARVFDELTSVFPRGTNLPTFRQYGTQDLASQLRLSAEWRHPGAVTTYSVPLGAELHEAGTMPLGSELLDENGESRMVQGLYALGACTFPRTGSAHPSLTVLALARRLAGHLS